MSCTNGTGKLRRVIEAAAPTYAGKPAIGALTVLSKEVDPYRFDRSVGHALGRWFADQVARFVGPDATVHLRGLHYRLVVSGDVVKPAEGKGGGKLYLNTDDDWYWLQVHAANAARWLEYVPFAAIRDERNAAPQIYVPDDDQPTAGVAAGLACMVPSLADAVPTVETSGFQARQPYRVCFIGEKSSLGDVLEPIARHIGAELLLPTGEISATMLAEMAARADADGRPCAVLYFSDFDPSGWQMPVSVARKLQGLRDLKYPDLDVQVHAVALTREHVREFNLPSTPLKETEKRAVRWREVWGVEQTEIDALAALRPDVLRQLAVEAVTPFYDDTLDDRTADAEQSWQDDAADILAAHPAYNRVSTEIEKARTRALAAVAKLHEAQQRALDLLSDLDPPPIELPEAAIITDAPEPLFSTDDDFATASRKLIARKALDGEAAP